MADNVPITAGSGTSIATDDVSGVHYQRVKLVNGTLDATDAIPGNGNGLNTQGAAAHGASTAGNPVLGASEAIAHGSNPTAVSAGQVAKQYANRHGVSWVIGGHMNPVSRSARRAAADGAVTDGAIGPTVNTGTKIAITRITVTASNANTVNVAVKIGFGTSTLPADSTTGANQGVLVDHEGVPPGGGFTIGDGSGILGIGADDEELRWTADSPTGGHIICSFTGFTIES